MSQHLTPEEAAAHAFGVETGEPHCDDCARRVETLRAGRARLAAALDGAPSSRARFPRVVSAIAAALCLGAVGFAVMSPRDPGPVPGSIRQDAGKWIADLSSEDPAIRDRATQELASLGSKIEALLKKSLEGAADPEVKARLTDLLARIEGRRIDRLAVGHGAAVRILKSDGTLIRELRTDAESDVHVKYLAWSPDGAWLAFLGDNVTKPGHMSWPVMDLHVADPASGALRVFARQAFSEPVWSPDARRVAVGVGLPGDPAEVRVITTADWKELPLKASGTPCFWVGESLVVFTGAALEKLDVTTGRTTKLWPAASPATSNGTRVLFYQSPKDLPKGTFNLCMGDLGTGKVGLLDCAIPSEYVVPMAPRVSPDGKRVAYEHGRSKVVVRDIPAEVGSKRWSYQEARDPAWSPEGRLAYLSMDSKGPVLMDLDTGLRTTLPGPSPAWSPAREK